MTKEQSTILKGIAILMMLFLHLFNSPNLADICEPLLFIGETPLVHIISKACSPVDIFLILSGYGFSCTYFSDRLSVNEQIHRLFKLYIHYWIILLIFVSIGCYVRPAKYPGSISDIILNFTSLSNGYNSETWFLFPYALLSLTSIRIFKIIDKLGCKKSIIISWFLYMISCYLISRYIAVNKSYSAWYNYLLTYFDVLFPFIIGAIFHRQIKEGRGIKTLLNLTPIVSAIMLLLLFSINCFISSAAISYFFEFAYIFLLLHFNFKGIIKRLLITVGKQSMIMWLTHSFFCYYLFHDFIYGFKYPLLIYLVLIVISYVISFPIGYFAKVVIRNIPALQ